MKVVSFAGHIPVPDPRITQFNLYRKRGTTPFARIAQIPVQLEYQDPDGQTGDAYYFTYFDPVRFAESGPSPVIVASDAMDAVTITGFAAGMDGIPTGDKVEVTIHLKGLSLATPIADGQLLTSLRQTAITEADGKFWFVVSANDRIFPANTFYMIEYLDRRFFKTVRFADGPSQLLARLQDVAPLELR